MRVALKKQFLDRLSSVICHHRVRGFTHLGIPNKRLDQAQLALARPNNAHTAARTARTLSAAVAQPAAPAMHAAMPAVVQGQRQTSAVR